MRTIIALLLILPIFAHAGKWEPSLEYLAWQEKVWAKAKHGKQTVAPNTQVYPELLYLEKGTACFVRGVFHDERVSAVYEAPLDDEVVLYQVVATCKEPLANAGFSHAMVAGFKRGSVYTKSGMRGRFVRYSPVPEIKQEEAAAAVREHLFSTGDMSGISIEVKFTPMPAANSALKADP